jgi:hypothetical protein
MSDDKSTPISALGGSSDDSEIVSQVLEKYNNLNDSNRDEHQMMASQLVPSSSPRDIPELRSMNPGQDRLEEQFENRDMNNQLYKMNGQDPMIMADYQRQLQKSNEYIRNERMEQRGNQDDEEYEEYEEIEYEEPEPMWRRVLNEIRIPFIIFIFVFLFFNRNFMVDKYICRYSFFGDSQHYECNWKGVLLKALIISILSYVTIRYIRI